MGTSLDVNTNSENEFNQQMQMYLAQGYTMQSNFNGTAILKKKSYSVGLLIVLIIFFFPAAIIYYLLASDDVVTIRNTNGQTHSNIKSNTEEFDLYCEECGHGLFKDSKFCPGCGKNLTDEIKDIKQDILKCDNCGAELSKEDKFCPSCGKKLNESE